MACINTHIAKGPLECLDDTLKSFEIASRILHSITIATFTTLFEKVSPLLHFFLGSVKHDFDFFPRPVVGTFRRHDLFQIPRVLEVNAFVLGVCGVFEVLPVTQNNTRGGNIALDNRIR